jgi:hypothetical protein
MDQIAEVLGEPRLLDGVCVKPRRGSSTGLNVSLGAILLLPSSIVL